MAREEDQIMQLGALLDFPFMTLSLGILFIGALFIYLFRNSLKEQAGKVAVIYSFLGMLAMIPPFYELIVNGHPASETARWSIVIGEWGLYLDGIAFPITFAIVVLGFLSVVYAVGYTEHTKNKPTFFANQLFFLMGMQWVTLATNLIEFFIAWELMLVPSYFLILFWGLPETRKRTALKFWLYTQSGAVCILVGFGLLYAFTGTFELYALGSGIIDVLAATPIALELSKLIFILLAAGFLVKMAVFPIHWWLPPVHAEAPTPISVLLSGAMIETGAYALVRFAQITLGFETAIDLSFYIGAIGVITMFYGGFMALAQKDIKRLLAYSSVSQMGYVLFSLGMYTSFGMAGGLFHLINHAFSKGLLFMTAGAVIHQTGLRDIDKMGGLSNKMPITAFAAAIGALSIAGSPPLSGFASEWMMFLGGFQRAFDSTPISLPFLILSILAVSSSILSAGYMLRFLWRVFLGPHPNELENVTETSRWMLLPMVALAVLVVIFGVFPGLALDIIGGAVEHISEIIGTFAGGGH